MFLFGAAALAGALNSVAGGGSFISFPALVAAGVPPVMANTTNSVAVWPGMVAATFAYRDLMSEMRRTLLVLGITSFAGGLLGAILLLSTSDAGFMKLVPWLLLLATVVFTFGGRLAARLRNANEGTALREPTATAVLVQLVIATYGGYFGGGMGIMTMAVLGFLGMTDIHTMNGVKAVVTTVINGISVVAFIVAGKVAWAPGLLMAAGATASAYLGATLSRKIDPKWVRRFVVLTAWCMTAAFFAKQYVPWLTG